MKSKKTYAVFGLGRYGTAVARELVENGVEVVAVDAEQKIVNDAAVYLPVCKCADVTDSEVISRLGIGNIDTVIICIPKYSDFITRRMFYTAITRAKKKVKIYASYETIRKIILNNKDEERLTFLSIYKKE